MRVLILNYEYPPLGGGAGTATRYLLDSLSRQNGIFAELITSSTDESRTEHIAPNATVHFLDIGKSGSLHYQSQQDLLVYAARAYFCAEKLIRREYFDVIHAFFGIPSGYVAMRLGLPYIVSLRGSDVPFYNRRFEMLDRLVFKRLSRKIWKNATHVVANSKGLRDLAAQSAPEQRLLMIPNGVDTAFFHPAEEKNRSETITLISTGRLIERKGYAYLIEALEGLPNVRLQLVGDGNLKDELRAAALKAGVAVEFLGAKSRQDVARLLRAADLFVLPSLNEGMSNSLLEATASGLPAVVTDVGGSLELVEDNRNGFTVPKENAAALRRVIEKYIDNPKLLELHGRASRRVAKTMSVEKNADRYISLYKEAERKRNK